MLRSKVLQFFSTQTFLRFFFFKILKFYDFFQNSKVLRFFFKIHNFLISFSWDFGVFPLRLLQNSLRTYARDFKQFTILWILSSLFIDLIEMPSSHMKSQSSMSRSRIFTQFTWVKLLQVPNFLVNCAMRSGNVFPQIHIVDSFVRTILTSLRMFSQLVFSHFLHTSHSVGKQIWT